MIKKERRSKFTREKCPRILSVKIDSQILLLKLCYNFGTQVAPGGPLFFSFSVSCKTFNVMVVAFS